MIRALCIADKAPAKPIKHSLETGNINLIITLGDLDISEISYLAEVNTIPKIGVYGNHCIPGYMEELNIINLHLQTITIDGRIFGGFEGCIKYKNHPYAKMYTQEEASSKLESMPAVDVLISHSPAFGINDDVDPAHIGFTGLRDYLDNNSVQFFLHGHTYPRESELITTYRNTNILYIHSDQIVTF